MSPAATERLYNELVATRDGQRSGAVDLTWSGTSASLFFVFGQPSHATVQLDGGRTLEGTDALDHLLRAMTADATIGEWRRVLVPEDTLRLSVDELLHRLEGEPAGPAAPPAVPQLTVEGFPLMPLGTMLWSDAAANVADLDRLAARMPDSLVLITADGMRAATVIARGAIVDSVYVDDTTCLVGDQATAALVGNDAGTITGYGLADPRLLASVPLLWRTRRAITDLRAAWVDVDRMVADIGETGMSCALLIDGPVRGVALFDGGAFLGSYTEQRRVAKTTLASLRKLVRTPGATVTLLHGKLPEPVAPVVEDVTIEAVDATPAVDAVETEATAVDADDTVAFSDTTEDDEAPTTMHMPPDVFSLPELEPLAPVRAAAPGNGFAAAPADDPLADHPDPTSAAAETLATIALVAPAAADEPADDAAEAGASEPVAGEASPAVFELLETLLEEPEPAVASEPDAVGPPDDDASAADEIAAAAAALADDAASDATPAASTTFRDAEFVPARLEIDVAALRKELIDIATVWLGPTDVAPVSRIIKRTRPGVDEFVGAVARIGAMQVPGHETAVVRAMAREMHYRVAEVLCAV